jgi:predicted Zn-dependent peptidase
VTIKDLKKIDPRKACQYFDDCFKDPSTFTVALVGNIDHQTAVPLILQYLVSSVTVALVGLFLDCRGLTKFTYPGRDTQA